MTYSDDLEDHFYSYVRTTSDDDCHRWTGARDPDGYGLFLLTGRVAKAHRLAAALSGMDIGDKHIVHTCGNAECVNPDHLYTEPHPKQAETREKESEDLNTGDRRRRAPKGEAHGKARLTRREVLSMRKGRAEGQTLSDLSDEYNVSETQVQAITTGDQWTHVGGPRTRSQGLSDRDVAEIRRAYWYKGRLQKAIAEVFGVQASYVSMLVRGKSRPDAPGPTSEGPPPLPSPAVRRQIRFAVVEAEASVSDIEETYGLPRSVIIAILQGDVGHLADLAPEGSQKNE